MTVTQIPQPQPNDSGGVLNYASGGLSTDATAAAAFVLSLGFTPRKIRVVDTTAAGAPITYEQLDQMPAANTLKTVGGAAGVPALTIDTTGLITIGTQANGNERNVTLAAGIMAANHTFVWEAFA